MMELKQLALLAVKSINDCRGTPFTPQVTLRLPESKRCSHARYPFGRKGPKGTAVAFGFDGYDTVLFDAVDILAFLAANGVVAIEPMEPTQ